MRGWYKVNHHTTTANRHGSTRSTSFANSYVGIGKACRKPHEAPSLLLYQFYASVKHEEDAS